VPADTGQPKYSSLGRVYFALYRGLLMPLYWLMMLAYRLVPAMRKRLGPRLGLGLPRIEGGPVVWFHASSMGETSTIAPVVTEIAERCKHCRLVVTTMTVAGQRRAREILPGTKTILLPFDFHPAVRRLITALKPTMLVIGETEIWPNLIVEASRAGVPLAVVNGRISKKSYPRYKMIRPLTRFVLPRLDLLMMRTHMDARRAVKLGACEDRAFPVGNVKYDNLPEPLPEEVRGTLRKELGLGSGRLVITLGSARDGETAVVLEAIRRAAIAPDPLVIVAPRHMNLVPQVEETCRKEGLECRTVGEGDTVSPGDLDRTQVVIFAQMGRMLQVYSISDIAIVGGTYRNFGGHNPLEPASQSAVTIVGPHIQNIRDDIAYLRARKGAFLAREKDLPGMLRKFAADAERRSAIGEASARAVLDRKGIAARCVDMMLERGFLPGE
jgi:3-deoxy-D-manno-octulosonic-acid transferase